MKNITKEKMREAIKHMHNDFQNYEKWDTKDCDNWESLEGMLSIVETYINENIDEM